LEEMATGFYNISRRRGRTQRLRDKYLVFNLIEIILATRQVRTCLASSPGSPQYTSLIP